ncbi:MULTISPECIES: serine/threonine protein kinase [Pseudoalteromonas]|jgi:Ser/Thr protein kinase RdoA (MazF antagonist)|uniref:Stress response kinase A n=1 Tax=Pseudoalteromonas atlantica TaxID=288 RepID=A0ABQ0UHW9_PSEAF|nr:MULTISPECIES: serine/threonine protein kinase [Pseudoalteromonas]GEK78038.1 stress response kinase A [Pseudoalteromonas atlantica]AZN33993.1 serine/threonine protein kinase [Pseudoalteromonas sp. Xi13]KPV89828.1 serine/threonine protein kinase [Pseudoalteromonas sp. P1-30]MCK8109061.1 serine/threonine protein kinase [Pseudoalteromonas sp. 2CM41L]MCQ8887866.1 serine/threonine protein kinase [Pseudoalteromonas agarivorans]
MSKFSFEDLTPDLILDAIESVGIYAESGLLALNSYENRVYQFKAEDGLRYVVKFYRPERWSKAQIQEEHDFAFELAEAEVPVVAPIKHNGESLFEHQGYVFVLFPSVGGRQFEVDNLDQLDVMGRLIGRMHQVAKSKAFEHRPTFSCEEYLHTAKVHLQKSNLVPMGISTAFYTILDLVIEQAQAQYKNVQGIRLHGDCHAGNILWAGEALMFVDLDDARQGPAIQDLWMMLSGDRQTQLLQLDTLVNAYEEFCDFDHTQLKLIEPLRAMRIIHYMGWVAKRWSDPAFVRNFSWFAEDKYWEQQILALKEQFAALQEAPLKLLP